MLKNHIVRLSCSALTTPLFFLAATTFSQAAPQDDAESRRKPATGTTISVNQAFLGELPFSDVQDFSDVMRGFVAPLANGGRVAGDDGTEVWDLSRYAFLNTGQGSDAPPTVNPSLWRQSQLLITSGLFKVTDRIYQVRNLDISNITFIEGDSGLIILDPLISAETAKAALALYYQHRPQRPIKAVIYSHSHVDHFGGVKGVVNEADVLAGKVAIIAPHGFLEEAVSENVYAGNAMTRRATYMYGQILPPDPQGVVGTGLGITTSKGTPTLIAPTKLITHAKEEMSIDGLSFVFQLAPDTEAPAEMHFYIKELRALCTAENATHTLHNVYTLRGAKIRDPRAWARAIDESLTLFGSKSDVLFAPHHWPVWGGNNVVDYLKKQRDMYQYINDQTLRLANHGYKMTEIAEMFEVPATLAKVWSLRGYYGSINHNVKATYVRYLGWYDGNPANLHPHTEVEASKKYVDFMGGSDAVLSKARTSFANGDYRWVAQVVNHVVMAEPSNRAARHLQADTLEQLGYQSENGTWRNMYLTAAQELRQGVMQGAPATRISADMLASMPVGMLFEYFAVRLNGPKAASHKLSIGFNFTDSKERVLATIENGVLHHQLGAGGGDVTVSMARPVIDSILLRRSTLDESIANGSIVIEGSAAQFKTFLGLLDDFSFWFNIVTPHASSQAEGASPPRG